MSVNVSMEKRRASARLLLVLALILFTTPVTSGQPAAPGDLPAPKGETSDPAAAADRFLGPKGETVRVEVVGCRTYKVEDVLHKLSRAYRFLLVAHPGASSSAYIAFVESSIELGYRHGGFPEAQVSAFHDKRREVVIIKIDEGERLMAGSVIVEGNRSVPAEAFIKELTERREEKKMTPNELGVPMETVETISAVWEPGTPAPLDFVVLRQAAHRARGVYLRAGFIAPEVEASWRRGDAGIALLVLKVAREGERYTLRRVDFVGDFSDDRQELVKILDVREGMAVDEQVLKGIKERLESLGRYFQPEVKFVPIGATAQGDVMIRLTQADFAPPLGQPWPEEQKKQQTILRAAVDWLNHSERWRGGHAVRVDFDFDFNLSDRIGIGPGQFEIALTHDGMSLSTDLLKVGGSSVGLSLIIERDQVLMASESVKVFSRFQLASLPSITAKLGLTTRSADQPLRVVLRFGARSASETSSKPKFSIETNVTEVALTHLVWKRLKFSNQGQVISLEAITEGESMKIGSIDRETGEVRFDVRHVVENGFSVTVFSERDGLAKRRQALETEVADGELEEVAPSAFLVRNALWLLKSGSRIGHEDRETGTTLFDFVLGRLLRDDGPIERGLRAVAETFGSDGSDDDEFYIPPVIDASNFNMQAILLTFVASFLAPELPVGSWPRTLLVEAACLSSGNGMYTQKELLRLHASEDVGPVGYLATAHILNRAGMGHLSPVFAQRGLKECNVDGFRKELALLKQIFPGFFVELELTLKNFDAETATSIQADGDEKETSRDQRTDQTDDPAQSARKFLELLWRSGIEGAVKSRLKELLVNDSIKTAMR